MSWEGTLLPNVHTVHFHDRRSPMHLKNGVYIGPGGTWVTLYTQNDKNGGLLVPAAMIRRMEFGPREER